MVTGKWGIKAAFDAGGFSLPLDPSNPDDVAAAERSLDFNVNYISTPLVLGIQPPEAVVSTLGDNAPVFTDQELAQAKGTVDFYGIDLYTVSYTTYVEEGLDACAQNTSHPRYPWCVDSIIKRDNWRVGAQGSGVASRTVLSELTHTRIDDVSAFSDHSKLLPLQIPHRTGHSCWGVWLPHLRRRRDDIGQFEDRLGTVNFLHVHAERDAEGHQPGRC
jgi:hypothetical protein